jgi:hypothetical protein
MLMVVPWEFNEVLHTIHPSSDALLDVFHMK